MSAVRAAIAFLVMHTLASSLVALVVLALASPDARADQAPKPVSTSCPGPGATAPPFSFPIPLGESGARASLSALKAKGKPIVLAFWAYHCAPCILEMPALQKLSAEWGENVSVLLVHVGEDEARMRAALDKWNIKLTSALDESETKSKEGYCVAGLPRLFVLDGKGVIRSSFGGLGEAFEETLRAAVAKAGR